MRFPLTVFTIMLLGAAPAMADECGDIAQRYASDRDSLSVGDLDALMACIGETMRDKAQGLPRSEAPASRPVIVVPDADTASR